jgi:peptide/nickel transport system substrate-binding protein
MTARRLTAILFSLLLLGIACAPTEGPESPEGAAEETGPFVYAHPTTFPDFDPSTGFSNDSAVNSSVYETLVRYHPGADELVSPVLATEWEANEDSTQWTFTLREGVKFHDGTDVTADAVKASIERTMKLGEGAAFIWDPVKSITAVDDLTVEFSLKYPAPLDLVASAGYGAYIFSPDCVKGKNKQWFNEGNDCGSGPYTFKSYQPGERAVLERFDDYWGGWEEGQFETVVLQVVEDPALRQQMIESGDADFTYDIPIDNLPALDENPDVRVVSNPAFQNLIAFFNTRKGATSDPKVREALSMAFPYNDYIDNVMQGYAEQSRGVVPRGLFGYSEEIPQHEQNLDQAEQLLNEAGVDGDVSLTLTYATGDQNEAQMAELWKAELAKIGVDLKIRAMSWEAQWDLAKSDPERAQDIFVMYWWPTYPTPYDFLFSMFHSEDQPFFNLSYYSNPRFDRTIDKANELLGTDKAEAEQMFVEAQKMLYEDAPAVPIFDQENIHLIREDIQGYEDNPAYSHVVFFYELSRGAGG